MMSLISSEQVIQNIQTTKRLIESHSNSNIRLNANGGNSILVVCDPSSELEFINALHNILTPDKYTILDLNELLCEFITEHKSLIEESFELLKGSTHQIFKAPLGEEGTDFFGLIIQAIADSLRDEKVPVLINAGSLYGSGIDNIHIMENDLVMRAQMPLIILYPATNEKDKLMFLGIRPASKYRCMIV